MGFELVKRTPDHLRGCSGNTGRIPITERGIAGMVIRPEELSDLRNVTGLVAQLIILDRGNQDKCRALLEECGALAEITAFFAQRPGDSFTPDYVDLWNLYNYIVSESPAVVWEFGSGISTVVMAYAQARRGGDGHVFAVEPDADWAASTFTALPSHLRERCDVFYSAAASCTMGGTPSSRFAELPDVLPDMIYIDGAPKNSAYKGAENIFFIEDQLEPGTTVLIDGRGPACQFFLKGLLKREWQMKAQMVWLELHASNYHAAGQPFGLDLFSNTMFRLVA